MKKSAVLICGVLLLMNTVFAGGILTNSNQSAQFARMLSRNASTDLDAVYFNPAGLSQLKNGFYFALDNQTIIQNRTINSEFSLLNNPEFKGKVNAPVFPTVFAVYKLDKWAFSAGFGPNAGGGSAKYDKGLPSFEKKIALLAKGFETKYTADLSLEGTSVFWGIQLGATYKINDILSVYGGVRYLPSVNTYKGNISNIQLLSTAGMIPAKNFLAGVAGLTAQKLQPIISGGGGVLTIAQAKGAGIIDAKMQAQLEGGLKLAGATQEQIDKMPISTVQGLYFAASQNPSVFDPAVGDKNVDTKQTGAGFTPIIGFDIHLDKLNVGLKYEHQTTLILTNKPSASDNYSDKLFPEKFGNDVPAIVSGGADYKLTDALKISGSFTSYIDNWVGWGNNVYGQHRSIDKNYLELAFGAEYKLTDNFAVSAGYLNSNTGVSQAYQSDFSYSNDSYTTGLGFQWNMSKKMVLDAGIMLTTYKDYTKTFDASFDSNAVAIGKSYNETYGKDTFTFAFGIGYKIF